MFSIVKHHKNLTNLFVAFVVFLNAMAPLSVVAKDFSNSDDATAEALFGDKIVICTPTGFKYISVDELNDRQNNGSDNAQNHCPLCLIKISSFVLNAVDLDSSFDFEIINAEQKIFVADFSDKSANLISSTNPRAPPSLT